MPHIEITGRWRQTFPHAHIGLLLLGNVDNAKRKTLLDERKREVEGMLREKYGDYSRSDLLELDVLGAYRDYFRQFNKTYHVLLQLESVVHKGKSLPRVSPLVDAYFAAELQTQVLTAGHDADLLQAPVRIDVSQEGDEYLHLYGSPQPLKPGDMIMADAAGIVCSVIYGQDKRTPITPQTRRALYVAYAPAGVPVAAVQELLAAVEENVRLFAEGVEVEMREVVGAA